MTRYHSLVVESESLPECLDAIAWTAGAGGDGGGVPANETAENARAEDAGGVVMALRHKHRPHYGVQFHPESVCSEFGERLYRNFASLAAKHNASEERVGRRRRGFGAAGNRPRDRLRRARQPYRLVSRDPSGRRRR